MKYLCSQNVFDFRNFIEPEHFMIIYTIVSFLCHALGVV